MKSDKTTLSEKSFFLIVSNGMRYCLSLAAGIVLARWLFAEKETLGTYQLVLSVHGLLNCFFGAGFAQSAYYFFPRQKESDRLRFLVNQLLLNFLAGIAVASLLFVSAGVIGAEFGNADYATAAIMFLPATVLSLMIAGLNSLLLTLDRSRTVALLNLFYSVSQSLIVLAAAYASDGDAGLTLASYTAVYFLHAVFTFWCCYRLLRTQRVDFRLGETLACFKSQLGYALPVGVAEIVRTLTLQTDRYMIGIVKSMASFADYTIATNKITALPRIIASSTGMVVQPKLVELARENKTAEFLDLWYEMTRKVAIVISAVAGFFVWFSGEFMLTLYSDKFVDAAAVMSVYLFVLYARIAEPANVIAALGKTRFIFYLSLVFFFMNLFANVLLIELFAAYAPDELLVAPAFATVVTEAVRFVVALWFAGRLMSLPLARMFPWKNVTVIALTSLAAGGTMKVVFAGFSRNFVAFGRFLCGNFAGPKVCESAGLFLLLLAAGCAFLTLYTGFLRVIGKLRPDDVRLVQKIVAGIFGRFGGGRRTS